MLLCNVHPDMEAYIVVVPTDLFARTDASGNFLLENVPPGDYLLRVWHESCEPYERRIEVVAGGPLALEIDLEPLAVR